MPGRWSPVPRVVLALAVQALVFWLVLAALGYGVVAGPTWVVLHLLMAIGLVALLAAPKATAGSTRWRARSWLAIAFYAAFLAAFLAGANFALDALHGAHRQRTGMVPHLGGLALWQVLCPGVFSLALGLLAGRAAGQPPAARSGPA